MSDVDFCCYYLLTNASVESELSRLRRSSQASRPRPLHPPASTTDRGPPFAHFSWGRRAGGLGNSPALPDPRLRGAGTCLKPPFGARLIPEKFDFARLISRSSRDLAVGRTSPSSLQSGPVVLRHFGPTSHPLSQLHACLSETATKAGDQIPFS